MKLALAGLVAAALTLGATASEATSITSTYTSLGGTSWLADFTVTNDGTPASFAGFTIDFPNATNLVLVRSPATWDSLVVQPDASIPDAGFLDSFAILASNYLALGQSLGGFAVSFNFASGTPGALPFTVSNANFTAIGGGFTTAVTPIPEPETVLLMGLGLAALGLRARRKEATA